MNSRSRNELPASHALRMVSVRTATKLGLEYFDYPKSDPRNDCVYYAAKNVWIRQDLGAWQAMLRIVPSKNGNPIIAEVRMFPHVSTDDRRVFGLAVEEWPGCYLGSHAVVPGSGLTARLMKAIKLGEAIQDAKSIIRSKFDKSTSGGPLQGFWPKRPASRAKRGGRKPIANEELVLVAHTYAKAAWDGELHPVRIAAQHHRIGKARASNWIRLARQRGLLEKADSTRPGGELTRAGVRLWKEVYKRRALG